MLRGWLALIAVVAMCNTVQSFRDHSFLSDKLYSGSPELVNHLQARIFGIWTLLSSVIRASCAFDIHNSTLYYLTLGTFVLALGHFLSEALIYQTAPLIGGVIAPLVVASISILAMLVVCVIPRDTTLNERKMKWWQLLENTALCYVGEKLQSHWLSFVTHQRMPTSNNSCSLLWRRLLLWRTC